MTEVMKTLPRYTSDGKKERSFFTWGGGVLFSKFLSFTILSRSSQTVSGPIPDLDLPWLSGLAVCDFFALDTKEGLALRGHPFFSSLPVEDETETTPRSLDGIVEKTELRRYGLPITITVSAFETDTNVSV